MQLVKQRRLSQRQLEGEFSVRLALVNKESHKTYQVSVWIEKGEVLSDRNLLSHLVKEESFGIRRVT